MKKELNETKTNLKMSWKFVKNRKKELFIMIVLSAILSGISIVTPILSAKLLLNLTDGLLMELLKIAIFVFIVEVMRNFVSFMLNKINNKYLIDTVTDVQIEMFNETLKIETSEIDKNTSGVFIDRINNDTSDIINIFSDIAYSFIDFISNVGILVAIFIINRYMFLYFIFTSIILWYIDKKRRDLYFDRGKKYRKVREKRTGLISEVIRGVRDVKLLNAEKGILSKTKEQLNEVNKERLLMEMTDRRFILISSNVRDFLDVIFFAFATFLVYKNNLSVSSFVILYMYKGNVENLLNFYNRLVNHLKEFNLSATRVYEVLGDKFKKEKSDGITKKLDGNIEFKNVSFKYDKDSVLNDVSFKINKGERVGFVGESGSGKSTIFSLITRLYNGENGDILLDNININDISIKSIRDSISLIPQSPYIFNFSIEDNIKLSNRDASKKEIIEVTKKADIYDRIMEFEHDFDTKVGEGGITLSGGEKQRIAIARSLLKKSNIILFDEATSSLDSIAQNKVQKAIYGLDREKTILIIAHRLSTVISCDKIVVVDDGKIVDIGSHDELLNRCSKYKELVKYDKFD